MVGFLQIGGYSPEKRYFPSPSCITSFVGRRGGGGGGGGGGWG